VAATASAINGSACSQPRPMESKAQALVKPAASISRAAAAMADAVRERFGVAVHPRSLARALVRRKKNGAARTPRSRESRGR